MYKLIVMVVSYSCVVGLSGVAVSIENDDQRQFHNVSAERIWHDIADGLNQFRPRTPRRPRRTNQLLSFNTKNNDIEV